MSEPTIKGWVWDIPFYPTRDSHAGYHRTIKDIFWYDSSNDLEFVNHTREYQMLVPQSEIVGSAEDMQYVHDNKEHIIANKLMILTTDHKGVWSLNIQQGM